MSRPGSPRPRPNLPTSRPRRSGFAGGSRLVGQGGASGRSIRRDDGQGAQEHNPEQEQTQGPDKPFAIQAPGHREKSPVPRKSERHAPLELAGSRRHLPVAGSRPSEGARLTATVPLQVTTSAVMPSRSRTRHRSPTVCRWGSCPGRPRRSDCRRSRRCRMWSGCPTALSTVIAISP